VKFQILRLMADGGEGEDARARADLSAAGDDDMRQKLNAVTQNDLRADMAEGPDGDALSQYRAVLDDGARVDAPRCLAGRYGEREFSQNQDSVI
jgi:hypothetical protein